MDHSILLENIDYYGIRGVAKDWFHSYLDNQKQCVACNRSHSSIKPISTGVAQESVSKPLLLLVYINDLFQCFKYSETYHFSHKTNMFQSKRSLEILVKRMDLHIKNLSHSSKLTN